MEPYRSEKHPPIVHASNSFLSELDPKDQVTKLKAAVQFLLRENRELRSQLHQPATQ